MDIFANILASPFLCLGWIIVGAIAGAVARSIMGSPDRPFIYDLILGWVGAFLGGLLASLLGFARPNGGIELVLVNLVISIIGAIVVIFLYRLFTGGRDRTITTP
jgi:uncharacterized membrane protein YeaQ/YmgE (transglycosylase-associated protein family)